MDKTVQVNQEVDGVGQHLVKLVASLKQAASDGLQLADIGVVATAVVADLLPAIAEVAKVKDAVKADLFGALRAGVLAGLDIVESLVK